MAFTTKPSASGVRAAPLRAEAKDETLYALGINVATQLGDIRKLFKPEEMPEILRGIDDYLTSKVADATPILRENANDINQLLQERMVWSSRRPGAAVLRRAGAKEETTQTASGLIVEHIKEGAGRRRPPRRRSSPLQRHAHRRRGRLSCDHGRAGAFAVQQVIKGWQYPPPHGRGQLGRLDPGGQGLRRRREQRQDRAARRLAQVELLGSPAASASSCSGLVELSPPSLSVAGIDDQTAKAGDVARPRARLWRRSYPRPRVAGVGDDFGGHVAAPSRRR